MSSRTYEQGVLVEEWNDDTRTYTDFTTDPDTTRPYTADENAEADVRQDQATAATNSAEITSDLDQALIDVQTLLDTPNSEIAATPAPYIKDLGHVIKKLIRKVNERYEGTE